MAINLGTLQANITANVSGFLGGFNRATQATSQFQAQLQNVGQATANVTRAHQQHQQSLFNLAGAAIRFSVILYGLHEVMRLTEAAIVGSISEGIKWNSVLEGSSIKWETLTKSVSTARVQLEWMKRFAAETPFEFKELDQASSKIKAYGYNLEQTRELIQVFGDTAAATNTGEEGINRMTRALGQMRAAGRVMAEEMMQLTELGIPAWEFLAQGMGKSQAELRKLVERGLVPAGQAIPIIVKGMNEAFGGLMQRQAQTMEGRWSTLKDTWREILGTAAKPLFDYLSTQLAAFLVRSEAIRKVLVESPNGGVRGALLVAFDGTPLANYIKLLDRVGGAVKGVTDKVPAGTGAVSEKIAGVLPGGAQIRAGQAAIGLSNSLVQSQDTIIFAIANGWDRAVLAWREGQENLLAEMVGSQDKYDATYNAGTDQIRKATDDRIAAYTASQKAQTSQDEKDWDTVLFSLENAFRRSHIALREGYAKIFGVQDAGRSEQAAKDKAFLEEFKKGTTEIRKQIDDRIKVFSGADYGARMGRPDIIPQPRQPVDLSEGMPKPPKLPDTKAYERAWGEFADTLRSTFSDSLQAQDRQHQKSQQKRIDVLRESTTEQKRLYDEAQADRVRTFQTTLDAEAKALEDSQAGRLRDFQKGLDWYSRQRDKHDQSVVDNARKHFDSETRLFQNGIDTRIRAYQEGLDAQTRGLERGIQERLRLLGDVADADKDSQSKQADQRRETLIKRFDDENKIIRDRQDDASDALRDAQEKEQDTLRQGQEKRMDDLRDVLDGEARAYRKNREDRLDELQDTIDAERKTLRKNQDQRMSSLRNFLEAEKDAFTDAQRDRLKEFQLQVDAEKRTAQRAHAETLDRIREQAEASITGLKAQHEATTKALRAEYDMRVEALEVQKEQIQASERQEDLARRDHDLLESVADAQKALSTARATGNNRKIADAQKALNRLLSDQAANAREDERNQQIALIDDQIDLTKSEATRRLDELNTRQERELASLQRHNEAKIEQEQQRIEEVMRLFDEELDARLDRFQANQQQELDIFDSGQQLRLDNLQNQFDVEQELQDANHDTRLEDLQDRLDEEQRVFDAAQDQRIRDLQDQFKKEQTELGNLHEAALEDLRDRHQDERDEHKASQDLRRKALEEGLALERKALDTYWEKRLRKAGDDGEEEKRIYESKQREKLNKYTEQLDEEKRIFDEKQDIKLADVRDKVEEERIVFNDEQDKKLRIYQRQLDTEKIIFDTNQTARMTRLRADILEETLKFGKMQTDKLDALQNQIDEENVRWARQQREKERQYGLSVDSLGRYFDTQTLMHADFINSWMRRQALAAARLGIPMVTPDMIPAHWRTGGYVPTRTPEDVLAGPINRTGPGSKISSSMAGFTSSVLSSMLGSSASRISAAGSVPVLDYDELAKALSKQPITIVMNEREVARAVRNPLNQISRQNGDTQRGR